MCDQQAPVYGTAAFFSSTAMDTIREGSVQVELGLPDP